MKNFTVFLSAVLFILAGFSCVTPEQPEDPFYSGDELSDDRTPSSIVLDGQIGSAYIIDDRENDASGSITVNIDIDAVDLSQVVIKSITIPERSTATVKKGDLIDLSSGSATFDVVAESGNKRTYTVSYGYPVEYDQRTPLEFKVANQVGDAVIEVDPDDAGKGTIEVELNSRQLDMTQIEIVSLTLPHGATSSVGVSGKLNLMVDPATITITSLSGLTRVFTIKCTLPPASEANSIRGIVFDRQSFVSVEDNAGDNTKGSIKVRYAQGIVTTALTVKAIEVSDFANASVGANGTVGLSGGSGTITVTAESGAVRTYTIDYADLAASSDNLGGNYKMSPRYGAEDWATNAIIIEGGVPGNAIWMNLYDKNWSWDGGENNVQRVNNYTMAFTVDGADASLNIVAGKVTLDPHGEYFSCKWGSGEDVSYMYQVIPQGASSWVKDTATGIISFYNDNYELLGVCNRLEPNTVLTADHDDKRKFTIGATEYAFHREFNKSSWWNGDHYNDYSRYVDNCRRVMWIVTRQ